MSAELLEIQPRELKFIFELKKQSSCSIRLVNKSNNHVAFKVKTTSPKNYCVRPNTGIIKPKSTCDFRVTMQVQRLSPPDMICKDKFLVQSTVVPAGTTDEDIIPSTFAKDDGRYIEENKLRVILVSPPNSPVLSPINGTLKQVQADEASILKDQVLTKAESFNPRHTVTEDVEESKIKTSVEVKPAKDVGYRTTKEVEEPAKDAEYKTMKEVEEPAKDVWYKTTKEVEEPARDVGYKATKEVEEPAKDIEYKTMKAMENLNLVKDIEEMKSKLNEIESKLSEAEVTISKLKDERRWTAQESESLRQEWALLRSKGGIRKVQNRNSFDSRGNCCKFLNDMSSVQSTAQQNIFITMSCQVEQKEMENIVNEGKSLEDTQEVLEKQFEQNVDDLKQELFNTKGIQVYVVKFRKNNLPHAHILACLNLMNQMNGDGKDYRQNLTLPKSYGGHAIVAQMCGSVKAIKILMQYLHGTKC